mmetsp:Transcript_24596/g.58156  ORF Transcript_24596/g.58156 Transcript_24596/m.58156 type:complete len:137 (+) Transcript_24596:90-500(+)
MTENVFLINEAIQRIDVGALCVTAYESHGGNNKRHVKGSLSTQQDLSRHIISSWSCFCREPFIINDTIKRVDVVATVGTADVTARIVFLHSTNCLETSISSRSRIGRERLPHQQECDQASGSCGCNSTFFREPQSQ